MLRIPKILQMIQRIGLRTPKYFVTFYLKHKVLTIKHQLVKNQMIKQNKFHKGTVRESRSRHDKKEQI